MNFESVCLFSDSESSEAEEINKAYNNLPVTLSNPCYKHVKSTIKENIFPVNISTIDNNEIEAKPLVKFHYKKKSIQQQSKSLNQSQNVGFYVKITNSQN